MTIDLVGYLGFEFLGGIDVLLDFFLDGGALAKVLGLVDFQHLGGQVGGVAVAKFLHGVHTGGLQELGELRANALYAEEVGMIHPGEDEVTTDTGLVFQFFTSLGSSALFKKLIYGFNANCNEFFCINGADTLNVDDFVSLCPP